MAGTGGGAQLVTVVAPSAASWAATFTAWAKGASGCWSPVSLAGQPAQPFRAQTGYGGLLPIAQRVPGDWATPTGLAALLAKPSADMAALADGLRQRDAAAVAGQVARLGDERLAAARASFTSFGTCSVADPCNDLIRLGLLPATAAA
jgi:hypothetical protein